MNENPQRQVEAAFTLKDVRQVKEGGVVLDGVTLEIAKGEITALIGPSGAGKTSLLRLLNRLDDPVAGEVSYRDRPITQYAVAELRRKVGFVFQTPVMFPGSVGDNLQTAWDIAGRSANDRDEKMNEALALAELDHDLRERDADRLSIGQKQRVNIARALMTKPEALLMDEPTSALDPATADRLMETVRRLSREKHMTIVMVTHRLSEARRASDTTVMMQTGRIIEVGSTADMFAGATSDVVREFVGGER